ncbi:MAG: ABC transporter ATP-binding protein [Parachlamydiaceae bacterium]|nr:ABC transporter ATP-binding protein [Parachlamydiaceae bacterium]
MNQVSSPLIQATLLCKRFKVGKKCLNALRDINISIGKGETLGLVGESGCGKSTMGKVLLRLEEPTSGNIYFQKKKVNSFSPSEMRTYRRSAQMIYQDPYASLNPRMSIKDIVGEGLDIHKLASSAIREETILEALAEVGLGREVIERYPHEFSGGQRQRIVIARAMVMKPQFIVCDEPLSSLDMCTQKQIMTLLLRFKQEKQLTYLFISHDLHAVREISDRVAVMYLGKIVEQATNDQLFSTPLHPYTQALLSAVPTMDPQKERDRLRIILKGELPSPFNPPTGCAFHPRCPVAMPICQKIDPCLKELESGHFVACHKFDEAD